MTLSEFYVEVARRADTDAQEIDAADVSRVLATAFRRLANLPTREVLSLVLQGLDRAEVPDLDLAKKELQCSD